MKRITLIPVSDQAAKIQHEQTPKSNFLQWCLLNGCMMAEIANNVDYDIFDYMWEDIKKIFSLDNIGHHITGNGDCGECTHNDEHALISPCWNCRPSNNMFEQAPSKSTQ